MRSIQNELIELFRKATTEAFPNICDPPIAVLPSQTDTFGDYQFNSAMQIVKVCHSYGRPTICCNKYSLFVFPLVF